MKTKQWIAILCMLLASILLFSACSGKSAYEIAVENGFTGSVDDWLKSLEGKPGATGDPGEKGAKGDAGANGLDGANGAVGATGATGEKGDTGETGNGIAKIELTATNGLEKTYTITFTNGTSTTFTVSDGEKGETGATGNKGDTGADGKSAYDIAVENGFDGDVSDWLLSLVGEKGEIGAEVTSVKLTATEGLVDTYTILFSNGTISTFTVTNANGIEKIEQTATNGLMDVYTITMKDGKTYPFTVTNGKKGDKGDKGDTGAVGPQGPQGDKGDTGAVGPQGPQGDKGDTGAVGPQGPQGNKGDTGDNGKTAEFRVEGKWLQWKYTDEADTEWKNLYIVDGTPEDMVAVKFVLNGGSLNGSAQTIYVTVGTTIELPTPTYHGYQFDGWYAKMSDEYAVPNTYRVHSDQTLYAKWNAGALVTGTKIYDLNDLVAIKNNLSGTYVLMNDIDCEGLAISIGTSSSNAFLGLFDGQGYTISNYSATSSQYSGLFGYNSGTIRNLKVKDFNMKMESAATSDYIYVGGIAGFNKGIIEKCQVQNGNVYVSLTNQRHGGLIAGVSSGTIQNCIVTGNVTVTQSQSSSAMAYAGGISGYNHGKILNCLANASVYGYSQVTQHGNYSRGTAALISASNDTGAQIKNCLVFGSANSNGVSNTSTQGKGDICGNKSGTISNNYKDVDLTLNSPTVTFATAMTKAQLSSKNFYSVSLGWDSDIWNYDYLNIENSVYPTLRSIRP